MPDFLATVNPEAKPRVKSNTYWLDPREFLIIQPPLSKNEKLPGFLKLREGELALSTQPKPGYFYLKHIGWYAPVRHKVLADLVELELTDSKIQHGTSSGYSKGCNGPLCRRINRERPKPVKKPKQQPVYEGTDPLLAVLTAYAYQQQNTQPKNNTEKEIADLLQKDKVKSKFGPKLIQ